jgi:hypothetical protein
MTNEPDYIYLILDYLDQNEDTVFSFPDILKNLSIPDDNNRLMDSLYTTLTDKKWIGGTIDYNYVHLTPEGRLHLNEIKFNLKPPPPIGTQNIMRDNYSSSNQSGQSSSKEIIFSYAWGDESEQRESREKIVNDLYHSLVKEGYKVIRDKYDLGYRGFISDFMARIGQGQNIVVAISKKYVKSPYCMFELYEISRNSNFDKYQFSQKVLPIMVEFIDFGEPTVIEEYLPIGKQNITIGTI